MREEKREEEEGCGKVTLGEKEGVAGKKGVREDSAAGYPLGGDVVRRIQEMPLRPLPAPRKRERLKDSEGQNVHAPGVCTCLHTRTHAHPPHLSPRGDQRSRLRHE